MPAGEVGSVLLDEEADAGTFRAIGLDLRLKEGLAGMKGRRGGRRYLAGGDSRCGGGVEGEEESEGGEDGGELHDVWWCRSGEKNVVIRAW